ncbi:hypothetical protein AXG93_857s1160 [Marchantia polymorpha subsp. ruderalis]|uniref:DNA (cytosine-5-)-methyltransferase n=1 Tax=Marchantia polymorpha subsp. ruderalis TaxID=1480154 RepID=A0A176WDU1_MARPO|nr:hypothetical protein AXG93_857s1160 [Marchantia polymorpha subsp. ruderalis]
MVIKTKRRSSDGESIEPRQTRSSTLSQSLDSRPTNRKRKSAPKVKAAAKRARKKSPIKVTVPDFEELSDTSEQEDDLGPSEKEAGSDQEGLDIDEEEIGDVSEPDDLQESAPKAVNKERVTISCRFLGKPLPRAEAISRWPHRYSVFGDEEDGASDSDATRGGKKPSPVGEDERCLHHYTTAEVDKKAYKIGDCVHVNAEAGCDYLGRILEFFESRDRSKWFRCQWFFRVEDTGIGKDLSNGIDHNSKRVFYSEQVDDNPLECIVEKKKVIRIAPPPRMRLTKHILPRCDYFFDMGYNTAYSTFYVLPEELLCDTSEELSTVETSEETSSKRGGLKPKPSRKMGKVSSEAKHTENSPEFSLLDLYSGCGAMSTGLCNGSALAGANLVTRWAVDLNEHACRSLKFNHPETEVRNESAEDFLALIKAWYDLCERYSMDNEESEVEEKVEESDDSSSDDEESVYEVESIVGIRWAGTSRLEIKLDNAKSPTYIQRSNTARKPGIEFKVKWKFYDDPEDDTWEPEEHLNCPQKIKEFVVAGQKKRILPLPPFDPLGPTGLIYLPFTIYHILNDIGLLGNGRRSDGDCDVICGGPPCQGASGFNRFRNKTEPLKCVRNKQIIVYMDIVEFLKPRFVLMENVVDILKFANGVLGRYALSRLVRMHYQAKLGLLVAGCYGLPQFRMRVFLWGAAPSENLPAYPLPTHSVVMRGHAPQSWEKNVVAYDETESPHLESALLLKDAISDMPKIGNSDSNDEMFYDQSPRTPFQKLIRAPQYVLHRKPKPTKATKPILYDHRSLELNPDDYHRVCQIPHKKGANFRDLKGIIVLSDGTVDVERKKRVLLPSGKPLVPDYAISFVRGKSLKPFGRLWWDETVSTVVTRAEPHNILAALVPQAILHPEQDRVLSIRENARLQGFPDWYKLFGSVKERYIQVGNAVAVPVARALGYTLGHCIRPEQKSRIIPTGKTALMQLPKKFPYCLLDLDR